MEDATRKKSRSRKCKSTGSVATRPLVLDQLARFPVCQDSVIVPIESEDAWGTGRNDQAPTGCYMR